MNAIKYFSCIVLLSLSSRIYSQIPDTIWTKTFGGPLSDVGISVKQTNDAGFIVAATTSSFGAGGQDIYLIKTNENGDTLWTKTFGGTVNDRASNVVQTNDNGYAIFGTTNSFGNGGDDFLFWKTDSLGNTEWFKTYGGINNEVANEGQQLSDSTYIIVGDTIGQNPKAWLIKTDNYGNFIWGRPIGSNSYGVGHHGRSVQPTDDGRYAVSGIHSYLVYPPDHVYDYFLSIVSSTGNSYSIHYYGALNFLGAWGVIVKKLSDGNLILGGTIREFSGGAEKPWIIKTDQIGNVIWDNIILGSQYPAVLTSIEPTNDNGFIFTLYGPNISLLKCDENGILTWEKIVGGPLYDEAYSISQISDGGYIVTGYTKSFGAGNSDVWLLKFKYNPPPEVTVTSPNGGEYWLMGDSVDIKWSSISVDSVKIQLSLNAGIDWNTITESTPSDSVYEWVVQAPQTSSDCRMKISDISDSTIYDISDTTFTIDMFPSVEDSSNLFPAEFSLSQNYPNPFNPSTKIEFQIAYFGLVTLKVYDILGNKIATLVNEEKSPGTYEVEFSAESSIKHPASGIYFYQLKAGNYVETKKMVLIK